MQYPRALPYCARALQVRPCGDMHSRVQSYTRRNAAESERERELGAGGAAHVRARAHGNIHSRIVLCAPAGRHARTCRYAFPCAYACRYAFPCARACRYAFPYARDLHSRVRCLVHVRMRARSYAAHGFSAAERVCRVARSAHPACPRIVTLSARLAEVSDAHSSLAECVPARDVV